MLDNNPFVHEVTEVSKKGKTNTASYIEAVLTTSKGTVKVVNVTGMNRYRDYIEDFTQKLIITINTTLGDYEKLLLSDTSAITITVTVYDIGFNSGFSMSSLATALGVVSGCVPITSMVCISLRETSLNFEFFKLASSIITTLLKISTR